MSGKIDKKANLVVAIYSHPVFFPPTLNALVHLSKQYENVFVVHRNLAGFDWEYPSNVTLLSTGEPLPVRVAEQRSFLNKIKSFLAFSILLCRTINKNKATTLLIYDCMPLLSYRIVRLFMNKPRVLWYHNHDVPEMQYLRKWSIGWWAARTQKWIFPRLTIFSLPALERKEFFAMERLKGAFYFLPNFPSKAVFNSYDKGKKIDSVIKLLYQGSIGTGHGLEEIITILNEPINGKSVHLVLKGFISEEYKQELEKLAEQYRVKDKLFIIGPSGLMDVIKNAESCHIGIAIYQKMDVMNKTIGTASNKIYEYAASGLPVLLYDNEHFKKHLQQYEWVFFTDATGKDIKKCVEQISLNYTYISNKARTDFENNLNFEKYFEKVCEE